MFNIAFHVGKIRYRKPFLLRSGAKWDKMPYVGKSVRNGKGGMADEATHCIAEAESVVDLNGEFRFKVDAKGRLSLPAKYRKALLKDLVVTRNPKDECLYVFEPHAFNGWVASVFEDKYGKFDSTDELHVRLRRKLKSRARDVEVDAAGRIILPAEAREAVGIEKEVAVVGNTGYFEVWDAKRYAMQDDMTDLGLLFG